MTTAYQNNVKKVVSCASNPRNFEQVVSSVKNPNLFVTLGIQPTLSDELITSDTIREILVEKNEIKAIGEVGLDYYWVNDDKLINRQKLLFTNCIELANEFNLPLVIHGRKATADCLEVLEKYAETPVLLHSFEGNLDEINKAKDLGYMITVPTYVTIRKNRKKIVSRAGIDMIMIETDSPFCSPSPDIELNTPSTIPIAGKTISDVLEIPETEVRKITTINAEKFYKI